MRGVGRFRRAALLTAERDKTFDPPLFEILQVRLRAIPRIGQHLLRNLTRILLDRIHQGFELRNVRGALSDVGRHDELLRFVDRLAFGNDNPLGDMAALPFMAATPPFSS